LALDVTTAKARPAAAVRASASRTSGNVRVGSRTATLRAGRSATVTVSLNATGRRLLSKRRRLMVRLTATQSTSRGRRVLSTQRLTFARSGVRRLA
jgi:hypothetical protein